MEEAKSFIINKCFNNFEDQFFCEKSEEVLGSRYKILDNMGSGECLRLTLGKALDLGFCKIASSNKFSMEELGGEDLLIISFCLKGSNKIYYNNKSYNIKKGDILYFRPTGKFKFKYDNYKGLVYFIDLGLFNKLVKGKELNNYKVWRDYGDNICKKDYINIERAPVSIRSYMDSIDNTRVDNILDYMKLKGCFLNYLTWFLNFRMDQLSCLNGNRLEAKITYRAKKMIIDNIAEDIYVRDIADRLNISTYKLQKSFKNIEGRTVYDYIKRLRIENSKSFLKTTKLPIIEISQKVGYENPSKFSSSFKSITGTTPSQYRKDFRKRI